MLKKIITISILTFFSHTAFAEEAADKAEFKKLYAEFNELFATPTNINTIIDVAERVYGIAPYAYGEDSKQYAVVTYNLAVVYDEKGGDGNRSFGLQNTPEIRAIELYKLYFSRLEKLETEYNQSHIEQYLKYITADAKYNRFRSNDRSSRELLKIAQSIDLPAVDLAELCFTLGDLRIEAKHRNQSKYFYQTAYDALKSSDEKNHQLLGSSAQILASYESASGNNSKAETYLLEASSVFNSQPEIDNEKLMTLYAALERLYISMGNDNDAKIYNEKLLELSSTSK
ncbi:MAG: hypothetical protein JKY84_12445 [Emcibacteraceae bacterium]|nr:hypothetical protein [Emcibacteraceae bacterium]